MTDFVYPGEIVDFDKVFTGAHLVLDKNQPVIIMGRDEQGKLYVASTHDDEESRELYFKAGQFFLDPEQNNI